MIGFAVEFALMETRGSSSNIGATLMSSKFEKGGNTMQNPANSE
jgi:phenylalanine-4-hydroxylase